MRVVELAGTPHEVGLGHGRALATEIHAHLDRWRAALAAHGIADPGGWIERFVTGSEFVAAASALTPPLADEVHGIADGAGLSRTEAWFLQLMDESWRTPELADHTSTLGCTTFGVLGGLRSWCGQTMDLERFRAGAAVTLRIAPADGPPLLVVTMAGCIGLLGASHAGFAVLVNALPQVPATGAGLPVAFVVRDLLARATASDAGAAVRDAPHATGQHYLIADAEQLLSFECSPAGVAAVMPGAARLWHTNHPLVGYVPDDTDAESDARWEAVRAEMAAPSWGRQRSRAVLQMPSVCRAGGDSPMSTATFAAVVFEQTPRATDVWLADGSPTSESWVHVGWRSTP